MDKNSPPIGTLEKNGFPPIDLITAFCKKWRVSEFSLFGSDVEKGLDLLKPLEVMVDFLPGSDHTLFSLEPLKADLEGIFQGPIHLVLKDGVISGTSTLRKDSILNSAKVIYAA